MPHASRTQHKAEAKYNVTTDFPRLDLHSAAAAGNLGLVEYAIRHGQPVNSVLDGVLPLHAAAAGGSVVVVLYLIDQGADVNVPRLPRRYSNEKKSDTGGLIVGSSGSTPLHFASANGHTPVVRILLSHGAHPDRADKHGVTPEMLARDNGWSECADLIRDWDWGGEHRDGGGGGEGLTSSVQAGSKHHHHHMHLKRSIDETIHLIKAHHSHHHHHNNASSTNPSPSTLPNREPSSSSTSHMQVPTLNAHFKSTRRPKSAGTDADQRHVADSNDSTRKLTKKFSLLHLLKKDSTSADSASARHSRENSPARREFERGVSGEKGNADGDEKDPPPPLSSSTKWFRARTGSESALRSSRTGSSSLDLQLHHTMSSESLRRVGRSPLGTPLVLDHRHPDDDDDDVEGDDDGEGGEDGVVKKRPSLQHHRTSSSYSQGIHTPSTPSTPSLYPKGAKLIRFNSSGQYGTGTPTPSLVAQILGRRPSRTFGPSSSFVRGGGGGGGGVMDEGKERRVRGCMSVGSLRGRLVESELAKGEDDRVERETFTAHPPESAPALQTQFITAGDGDDKESSKNRRRGGSVASSSVSSDAQRPSPGPGEGEGEVVAESTPTDFHFTIDKPPQPPPLGSSPSHIEDTQALHSRQRRDSVSSTDTEGSGGDDAERPIPIHSSPLLTPPLSSPNPPHQSVSMLVNGFRAPIYTHHEEGGDSPSSSLEDLDFSLSSRYHNASSSLRSTISHSTSNPVDLDLDLDLHTISVSSRAEASALVQKAQASILQLSDLPSEERTPEIERVPLSARLAAYGEVLALERRFKRGERQRELWASRSESEPEEEEQGGGLGAVVREEGYAYAYGTPRSPKPRAMGLELSPPPLPSKLRLNSSNALALGITGRRPGMAEEDSATGNRVIPTRSTSNPLEYDASSSDELPPPAAIVDVVETPPTPLDSKSPHHTTKHRVQSHRSNPSLRPPPPPPINLSLANESVPSLPSITGVPLTRVSTAPLDDTKTPIDLDLVSTPEGIPKHKGSATKLARMGFITADEQNVSVTLPMTPPPSSKAGSKRFVGIKSLMLNLKGKS